MRHVVKGAYVVLVLAVVAKEVYSIEQPAAFDYHRRFGIPKAAQIKKWEQENAEKINNQRIIGGWIVDISQLPFQAGLVIQMNWFYQSICGASIISPNRLVTAAHCRHDGLNNANSFTVVLGSNFIYSGGVRIHIPATNVIMHPSWNPETLEADIAVVQTSSFSYSNVIQPIHIPIGNELWWDFTDVIATASGYGMTGDNAVIENNQRLSAVNVQVMSNTPCRIFYGQWMRDSNICTSGVGYRGTCGGDSGGPLAVNVNGRITLIGVASFNSWYGCEAGDPSAYARVTSFADWIRTV